MLKNLVRDWSADGAAERAQSYGRMTAELKSRFAGWPADAAPPRVLVPGAGLGRLALEVAAMVRTCGLIVGFLQVSVLGNLGWRAS